MANHNNGEAWSHELSYRGLSISAIMHRRRLKHLFRMFHLIEIGESGALADFGCSNGYIISLLQARFPQLRNWQIQGYDVSEDLLALARERQLPNCCFDSFDLNVVQEKNHEQYDIVICLETLEHVGNYENALQNLYNVCKPGGTLLISIPNETQAPGALKYFGRRLFRRHAYSDFFDNQGELKYIWHLLTDKSISEFREPGREFWPQHLGFDWRKFDTVMHNKFVQQKKLMVIEKVFSTLNFGLFYVTKKTGNPQTANREDYDENSTGRLKSAI